jgi:hypothetical protein
MTVVLMLLSIIAKVLLICLAVIILFLLLLLFVPVLYRADGKSTQSWNIKITLNWLFRFAGLTILLKDSVFIVRLHIAKWRKVLYRSDGKKTEKKKKKKKEKKKKELAQTNNDSDSEPLAGQLKQFFTSEKNRNLLKKIFRKLKYLGKHAAPKMIRTNLEFSLGEPDKTGLLVGGLSLIPLIYQYEIGCYPDFESDKPYLSGSFHITGHIRLVHVAVTAVSLLMNKQFRVLLKGLRRKANG